MVDYRGRGDDPAPATPATATGPTVEITIAVFKHR